MNKRDISKIRVLVVDDDTFMLDVITATLKGIGIEDVKTALSGSDALALLDKGGDEIDVVMCDLYMPEMDGIEFLDLMMASKFNGSVVLFSGVNQQMLKRAGQLAEARQIKILGCLEKPLTEEDLENLLSQVEF